MFVFRIPLGRARVIRVMVISPAKQLFLNIVNNAFLYLTTFSETRANFECDRGQETLLYRIYRFYRTQCADRVSLIKQQLRSIVR